jgi:glycosyltransferase involved in cell wall biosynthesis
MLISVVVTTYNEPAWLEKVLQGYAGQSDREFEVVVADDGSGPETAALLERLRPVLGVPLLHVWHEDQGFRKTEILNKAILAARGDYLLFTDGDCIPRSDFVGVHRALARPRRFLSGGYIKLSPETSRVLTSDDVRAGRATDLRWLRAHGLSLGRQTLRLAVSGFAARMLDALTPTRASWNGHNSSGWKADLVAANGFEERMQYGGLDRELGERLENAGIRGVQIRHRAIVVHLDHPRGYRNEEAMRVNRAIRDEVAAQKRTRAVVGLDRHMASPRGPEAASIA